MSKWAPLLPKVSRMLTALLPLLPKDRESPGAQRPLWGLGCGSVDIYVQPALLPYIQVGGTLSLIPTQEASTVTLLSSAYSSVGVGVWRT